MHNYVMDPDGSTRAVSFDEYVASARDDFETTRRIGKTTVGSYEVSTVFLGLDHKFGSGPPLLFETMIFNPDASGYSDLYCDRYATRDEAAAGHARVVGALEAGRSIDEIEATR